MKVAPARVIRGPAAQLPQHHRAKPTTRIVRREILQAQQEAATILAAAHTHANAIVSDANARAATTLVNAREQAVADASAQLAACWIKVRERELRIDDASLDRTLAIARLIAERLLGDAHRLDPNSTIAIARQALRAFHTADTIEIAAHPTDIARLAGRLSELGVAPSLLHITADPSRSPGNLMLRSSSGILDASLRPQLDLLIEALRTNR